MIDIRIEKLSVAHDPGSSHSAMNPGNASCTGASSKAALTPPNLKATHVVHVPIDAEMPDSSWPGSVMRIVKIILLLSLI
jgi:hypothetical protein